jgi:hypothetical protein
MRESMSATCGVPHEVAVDRPQRVADAAVLLDVAGVVEQRERLAGAAGGGEPADAVPDGPPVAWPSTTSLMFSGFQPLAISMERMYSTSLRLPIVSTVGRR